MIKSRAPQRIKNQLRMLYVKALRLANDEPTETKEVKDLYYAISRRMNSDEEKDRLHQAANAPSK